MKNTLFATAALVAAATASSVGSAVVVNKCSYDVTLANVPSADGGYSEVDKTLSPSETYTQTWTALSNGNGWSIKLSNDTSLNDVLQYEYTYQNDGTIWYDLSEINGNPWDGNWEITADTSSCTPKQQAYRYATDDAYGMQSCSSDATITVTLCSGEDDSSASSSESSSIKPATTVAAASTTVSSPATTLQTSVVTKAASLNDNGEVVVTETYYYTTTQQWSHNHHRRHPHGI